MHQAMDTKDYDCEFTLAENSWTFARWEENDDVLVISLKGEKKKFKKSVANGLKYKERRYFLVCEEELVTNLVMFFSQFNNRNQMNGNRLLLPAGSLNKEIGKGTVYKNFNNSIPLIIN